MEELFVSSLDSTVTTSIIVLALIVLSPLLNRVYIAKWKYWVWMLLAVRLILLPVHFPFPQSLIEITVPETQMIVPQNIQSSVTFQTEQETANQIQTIAELSLVDIAAILWLVGIVIFAIHQFIRYQVFKRNTLRWSYLVKDSRIIKQLKQVSEELGITKPIKVLTSEKADSPMMVGFFTPVLLLPGEDYRDAELYFIFKHELIHYQRRDIWYKLLLLTANAIHWFNPLIYMMFQEANKDLELACDDEVTRGISFDNRKLYSETILASVHQQSGYKLLTTHFYGGYKIMKERFQNILNMKTKRRGVLAFLLLIACMIISGGMVACSSQNSNNDNDAVNVVTKYLEAKKDNNFESWKSTLWAEDNQSFESTGEKEGDLGVISLTIDKVEISDEETQRIKEQYTGSDLANNYGWADDYIDENMVAVLTKYTVDYDNTKVPHDEGEITQYFYLLRADKDSPWFIWNQSFDVGN